MMSGCLGLILSNGEKDAQVWRRACCENFIKEEIYGFGPDRVVSHSYAGNYAWYELLMLAYSLMNFFKEEVLNQKKVKNPIQTIRDRLFSIPARLISSSRQHVLKQEKTFITGKNVNWRWHDFVNRNHIKIDRQRKSKGEVCSTHFFFTH